MPTQRERVICATGHIKDPMPLIEKSRASCPGGPGGFIHQEIIITGLNTLYDCMFLLPKHKIEREGRRTGERERERERERTCE